MKTSNNRLKSVELDFLRPAPLCGNANILFDMSISASEGAMKGPAAIEAAVDSDHSVDTVYD